MKNQKLKFLLNGWILVAFVLVGCDRTKDLTFSDFDENEDEVIEPEEFEDVFTANYYDDWDNENDAYLDDEDFYSSVYSIWDADGDEFLTEEEWTMGYDYYYGDYIVTDFEAVDVDNDGFVEYVEFYDVIDNTDFYTGWDADASEELSEEELAEGVFTIWDVDNSGNLEIDEFRQFDTYYLGI